MMLMDYYKVFGTKNCVFDDLRMYLDTFRTEDVNEVCVVCVLCGECVCVVCALCGECVCVVCVYVWCVCAVW